MSNDHDARWQDYADAADDALAGERDRTWRHAYRNELESRASDQVDDIWGPAPGDLEHWEPIDRLPDRQGGRTRENQRQR